MLDLDGTTIPNNREGMPSVKVTEAILKASKFIKVGVVSSRPVTIAYPIIKHLRLSSPCIVDGGSQILDPVSNIIVWEQTINADDASLVFKIAERLHVPLLYSDGHNHLAKIKNENPKKIFSILLWGLSEKNVEKITKELSGVTTLAVHRVPNWDGSVPVLGITHAIATKQHAILKVAEILRIDTHEIIGVGDGYNDFPLLMACGLKVAMGNAVQELKEIADYIAPTVEDDGVADVIEKFILSKNS